MNTAHIASGAAMNNLPAADRVSVRAVLAADGEDVTQALAQAGIVDPVAISVQIDSAGGFLGDGITPNLTGVLEPDLTDDGGPGASADTAQAPPDARPEQPGTVMLPPEHGLQALAPVRKRSVEKCPG
jgi:hypothetical protein